MSTKTAPKSASGVSQKQNPSTDYINKGIEAAENFANQGGKQPSAAQGINDARKMAGKIGNAAGNPQMALAKGAGNALMRGIKGNKNNAKEQTRRQKVQKELINRGKKILDSKVREAAMANAAETFGLSIVAYYAVKKWKVTIAVIASIFLVLFAIFDQQIWDAQQEGQNPLQIRKEGPTVAKKGDTLPYIITVSYPGSATNAVVTDHLPDGTSFVCSTVGTNPCTKGNSLGEYDKASNTVTWDAQKLSIPLTNSINFTLFILLKATQDNNNVINYAQVSLTGGSLSNSAAGGNAAANHDTCNGKYTLNNPLGNYGDPQCNFTRQGLGTQENQLDPAHKYTWDCIARYETGGGTGYNPNAYNGSSASGKGAYGLYQMNPPGKGNNKYDNGGVNWPVQLSNAVNYNKGIGGSFGYWGTYYTNGGPCH